jgi:MFS family permease
MEEEGLDKKEELLRIERSLWTNDAVIYEATFLPDAILIFPEVGRIGLIIARLAQGATAALMVPQVLATIHVLFSDGSRAQAFAIYGVVLGLGGAAASWLEARWSGST